MNEKVLKTIGTGLMIACYAVSTAVACVQLKKELSSTPVKEPINTTAKVYNENTGKWEEA